MLSIRSLTSQIFSWPPFFLRVWIGRDQDAQARRVDPVDLAHVQQDVHVAVGDQGLDLGLELLVVRAAHDLAGQVQDHDFALEILFDIQRALLLDGGCCFVY